MNDLKTNYKSSSLSSQARIGKRKKEKRSPIVIQYTIIKFLSQRSHCEDGENSKQRQAKLKVMVDQHTTAWRFLSQ